VLRVNQHTTAPNAVSQVTTETEELRFNTAIAAMMEFMNAVYKWPNRPRAALTPFVLLLAPYAPHLAEELWSRLGNTQSLTYEPWPQHDEALLVQVRVLLYEWWWWCVGRVEGPR
jgi:leucyl-tRNA synthetase